MTSDDRGEQRGPPAGDVEPKLPVPAVDVATAAAPQHPDPRLRPGGRPSDSQIWTDHQTKRTQQFIENATVSIHLPARTSQVIRERFDLQQCYNREFGKFEQLQKATGMQRFQLRDELRAIHREMEKYPEFNEYLTIRGGKVPSLDEVKALLAKQNDRRVVLVDWVFLRDQINIMVTSSEGVHPIRRVELTVQSLTDRLQSTPWTSAHGLRTSLLKDSTALQPFEPLIAPLADLTKPGDHLVLCPSGLMTLLPLHALEISGVPLIARNLVSQAPSAAVLRILIGRRGRTGTLRNCVFANPTADRQESESLGREIGHLLGVPPIGPEAATRAACIEALQTSDIFHFQGHAKFDVNAPLNSHLRFKAASTASDAKQDTLSAADILALAPRGGIAARLVTLGACESAACLMAPGDEPSGLTIALLAAGAHSVCAPMWPVHEDDTITFMRSFYQHLRTERKPCLAKALQVATLDLMRKNRDFGPYSWAPFMLHGDWLRE